MGRPAKYARIWQEKTERRLNYLLDGLEKRGVILGDKKARKITDALDAYDRMSDTERSEKERAYDGYYQQGLIDEYADLVYEYQGRWRKSLPSVRDSVPMLFPSSVVDEITSDFSSEVDPLVPFQPTLIVFDRPVDIRFRGRVQLTIHAFTLSSDQFTERGVDREKKAGCSDYKFGEVQFPNGRKTILYNARIFLDARGEYSNVMQWEQGSDVRLFRIYDNMDDVGKVSDLKTKNLVSQCINYINSREAIVFRVEPKPRKKDRNGKGDLPKPYYVCRIRRDVMGGDATGAGVKHGHEYDVRAHTRHLQSGRTAHVRQHRRGIANNVYVPKTYKV